MILIQVLMKYHTLIHSQTFLLLQMKKLRDICLDFIANNLYGNITCIVHNLARVHKEELLERMVCHDQLDKILLPHVTYNLFSVSLKRVTFYRSSQVTDKILLQLSNSGCQLTHLTIVECALVTGEILSIHLV